MKRIILIASALVLAFSSFGLALDQTSPRIDTLVVDRTTRNAAINNYVMSTRDSIQNVWTTPVNINTSDPLKGKVAVNYEIASDGSLGALQLVRGSGNPEMDESLLKAIRAAAPFPRFPRELIARKIQVRANFIVADLPVVPVLKVEHQVETRKKYIWGVPAGTALRKDLSIPRDESVQQPPSAPVPFPPKR